MKAEFLETLGAAAVLLRREPGLGLVVDHANGQARALFRDVPAAPFLIRAWGRQLEGVTRQRAVALPPRPGPRPFLRLEGLVEQLQAAPLRALCILREIAEGDDGSTLTKQALEAVDILDRQSEMVARWRVDGRVYYCNDAYARQCGLPKAQVIGASLIELTPADELPQILANIRRLTPERPTHAYDHLVHLPDGRRQWHEWVDQALVDGAGRIIGYQSVGRDVTARRLVEERLRDSEKRLRLALDVARVAIWELDLRTRLVRLDAAAHRSGLSRLPEEFKLCQALRLIHPEDQGMVLASYRAHAAGIDDQIVVEHRMTLPDGGTCWLQQHAAIVERDAAGQPLRLVGVAADITARKEADLQLAELALQDHLTGLPNRRALDETLIQAVARAERAGDRLGVLVLDLDGFKAINDQFGHLVGDTLLAETARRLRLCVRRSDVVSRFGGDEFTVLAGELKDAAWLRRLASRIVEAVSAPILLAETAVTVRISIGAAIFPEDGRTPTELLRRADAALYAAKRQGAGFRFAAELDPLA